MRQAAHLVWLALGACPGLHTLHVTPSELCLPAVQVSHTVPRVVRFGCHPSGHKRHSAPAALTRPAHGMHSVPAAFGSKPAAQASHARPWALCLSPLQATQTLPTRRITVVVALAELFPADKFSAAGRDTLSSCVFGWLPGAQGAHKTPSALN